MFSNSSLFIVRANKTIHNTIVLHSFKSRTSRGFTVGWLLEWRWLPPGVFASCFPSWSTNIGAMPWKLIVCIIIAIFLHLLWFLTKKKSKIQFIFSKRDRNQLEELSLFTQQRIDARLSLELGKVKLVKRLRRWSPPFICTLGQTIKWLPLTFFRIIKTSLWRQMKCTGRCS